MKLITNSDTETHFSAESLIGGTGLREVRRSRGLTQHELAKLLNVAQPNISRWEAGVEDISPKCRTKLAKIFLGKNSRQDRFVEHLVQVDPYVSVYSLSNGVLKFLHMSANSRKTFRLDQQDVVGRNIEYFFNREWVPSVYGERSLADVMYCSYSHDLNTKPQFEHLPKNRVYVASFLVDMEGFDTVLVVNCRIAKATGQNAVPGRLITKDDLIHR